MDSKLLVAIHLWSVNLFLLLYLVKTVLLFTNPRKLDRFSQVMKVPEMIISTLFLVSGIWLFAVLGAIKVMQIAKLGLVLVSIPLAAIGFKKHKKGLALISLLFIISAYGISEAARNRPYLPSKVEISGNVDAAEAEGMKLYLSNCAMCHGTDGNKEYRGAASLSATRMDALAAAMVINSGVKKGPRGTMPAFNTTLTEPQVNAIAAYIQGLKK